ncbi:unnamed protein product [Cuscuta epithymum]|uniref:Uncharacterized protein n=1 Tax=Cuscuta epithymum TaxID=186058 RepID=A0AAV0EWR2_9ASTE|nr:unnamed protein product [Cuscuta epithymum]
MPYEPSMSAEKRGASPEALAEEVPNPKRIEPSVFAASGVPLYASFTQLVNDPSINNLAQELAVDPHLIQMVKDLLEPLQNDGNEHVICNLDAWKQFASLQIWQNQKHCRALNQCLRPCPLETDPKQVQVAQQIEEQMSCIKNNASFKPILGDREPVAMMRAALIILITSWSGKDVIGDLPEPMNTDELCDSDTSCESTSPDSGCDSEYMTSLDSGNDSESTTSLDSCSELLVFKSESGEANMIPLLVYGPSLKFFTDKVLKDEAAVQLLNEFLGTLFVNSEHTCSNPALDHFDKVKKVWGHRDFLRVLLKEEGAPYPMKTCKILASRKLTEFIVPKIRSDPSFKVIVQYTEPASMMRSALSIIIGFWANEVALLPLVYTMGGRAFGVKKVIGDALPSFVKEAKTHSPLGEERCKNQMCMESPACCIIAELCQDESISKLADQLTKVPKAVTWAEEFLASLKDDVPVKYAHYFKYIERHRCSAMEFWFEPVIILQLIKALKESAPLVNVFHKYSKGAQLLRCQERMIRINKDRLLGSVVESDFVNKMRKALSILFGYWSDKDVTLLFSILFSLRGEKETFAEVDLTEESVQCLHYLTNDCGDVEGLKNVLADNYREDSAEYIDLFEKIRSKEQNAMKLDNDTDLAYIVVILKGRDILYFKKTPCGRTV